MLQIYECLPVKFQGHKEALTSREKVFALSWVTECLENLIREELNSLSRFAYKIPLTIAFHQSFVELWII